MYNIIYLWHCISYLEGRKIFGREFYSFECLSRFLFTLETIYYKYFATSIYLRHFDHIFQPEQREGWKIWSKVWKCQIFDISTLLFSSPYFFRGKKEKLMNLASAKCHPKWWKICILLYISIVLHWLHFSSFPWNPHPADFPLHLHCLHTELVSLPFTLYVNYYVTTYTLNTLLLNTTFPPFTYISTYTTYTIT